MRTVSIEGKQFAHQWDNRKEIRPYRMRTSFCLMGHYQAGNRSKARDWLDRIRFQGFDGPRLFGENQHWFDEPGPFYGNKPWTPKAVAVDHYNISSSTRLVSGYYGWFEQLVQDLMDRDMIAEFCCVATLKSVLDEGQCGHVLNRFAQMGYSIFGGIAKTPIIWEIINEWNAYTDRTYTGDKVTLMVDRFTRSSPDPTHHNYPGALVSCSAGGSHSLGRPFGARETHYNKHLPRQHNRFPDNNALNVAFGNPPLPGCNNETIHYMTQAQYDAWVPIIPKWHGLSCTNGEGLLDYIERQLALGISVCAHDLVGQQTDPSLPETPFEQLFQRRFGAEPQPKLLYKRIITQAYQEILGRAPDRAGLENYNALMDRGWTEAGVREALIRSPEYREKNS